MLIERNCFDKDFSTFWQLSVLKADTTQGEHGDYIKAS